jgi:hypothetical protein
LGASQVYDGSLFFAYFCSVRHDFWGLVSNSIVVEQMEGDL